MNTEQVFRKFQTNITSKRNSRVMMIESGMNYIIIII